MLLEYINDNFTIGAVGMRLIDNVIDYARLQPEFVSDGDLTDAGADFLYSILDTIGITKKEIIDNWKPEEIPFC